MKQPTSVSKPLYVISYLSIKNLLSLPALIVQMFSCKCTHVDQLSDRKLISHFYFFLSFKENLYLFHFLYSSSHN